MNNKVSFRRYVRFVFVGLILLVAISNLGFAQNQPLSVQKIMIGVGVWLVTAILAFMLWGLLKVIAKIGVFLYPILAGVMVVILLPERPSNEEIISICGLWGILGLIGSLGCYLYASIYDVERDVKQLKREATVHSETNTSTPFQS